MSSGSDLEYKCTLNAKYQQIALDLLGEDESTRNQALEQFREWIQKHTNITNCRLDAPFLLRFLRMKRFYVPDACQMLERYLLFRHNNPKWTTNLDVNDAEFRESILSGICFPLLEKSRSGNPILFFNMGRFDPERMNFDQMSRVMYIMMELVICDEEAQITGCNHIGDDSGLSMAVIASWPIQQLKEFVMSFTKTLPIRHNSVCIVELPSYANAFFQLMVSFMSEKIRSRFTYYENFDVEALYKDVDRSVLPKEYGGKVESTEMIAIAIKKLEEKRDEFLSLDELSIKEAKVSDKFYQSEEGSMNGTFRKLGID